jgi:hypothetical protein
MRRALLLGVLALTFLGSVGSAAAAGPALTNLHASNIWSNTAVLNGDLDSGGEALTSCHFTYGFALTFPTGAMTVACHDTTTPTMYAVLSGLVPSTTYAFSMTATDADGTTTVTGPSFATTNTPPPAPTATTDPASGVSDTAGTLNGTIDPKYVAVTNCYFEYGKTIAYGSYEPCSPLPQSTGSQTESAGLTGLSPSTTYHFQIVVTTEGGTVMGGDQSFITSASSHGGGGGGGGGGGPVGSATTGSPSGVTATAATLHGSVNPKGRPGDSCAFYYGTGRGYQSYVPCSNGSPSGSSSIAEKASVSGLEPGTSYHYVIVLMTHQGPIDGHAVTFTTLVLPRATTRRATRVRRHTAVLHGRVNAEGSRVIACYFQYARRSFKHGTPKSTRSVGCRPHPGRSGWVSVHRRLTRLRHRTRYYFRVVLRTQTGKTIGATRSFRTRR